MPYLVSNESFNAGIITSILHGQNQIEPRPRGLHDALNFLARVEGPVYFRGGSLLVGEVRDSELEGRLLPFVFNDSQAYVLDVDPGAFRFVFGDGVLVKTLANSEAWATGTAYAVDDYRTSGGALYRCTQDHDTDHEPGVAADWADYWAAWDDGGPYEISNMYDAANVQALNRTQSADVLFLADGAHPIQNMARTYNEATESIEWRLSEFETEDGPYLTVNTQDDYKLAASAKTGTVTVTASGGHEPFVSTDVGRHLRLRHGTVTAGYTVGWGVITAVTDATHVTVEVRQDFGETTATSVWWLGAWSETTGWPSNVGFINQAFAAAATPTEPQTIYKSNDINIYNFGPTNELAEVTDELGFSKTIGGSDQINPIHSFAWSQYLVLFTGGGVWRLVTTSDEPITPSNGTFRLDCGIKAADIDPVRMGPITVFVQKNGKKVYRLQYKFENDALTEQMLSRLSATLFDAGIREVVLQEEPGPYLWFLLGDGRLVCMVHDASENVTGCFPVRIAGGTGGDAFVESICVIPGDDNTDHLYLRVKRTINGATLRTIERLTGGYRQYMEGEDQETILARQKECFFVDCGQTYDGEATTTISGLDLLEGEAVRILADGAVHPEQVVDNGSITLQSAASKVHVGLGYHGYIAPARREFETRTGTSHGKSKLLQSVNILVRESADIRLGPSLDKLDQPVPLTRADRTLGSPPPLYTGEIRRPIKRRAGTDFPDVYLYHDSPTPCEVQRFDRFISVEEK